MGRKLTTTALIKGVVYEAGTDEAEIRGAETVTADIWGPEAGTDEAEKPAPKTRAKS